MEEHYRETKRVSSFEIRGRKTTEETQLRPFRRFQKSLSRVRSNTYPFFTFFL